MKKTKNFKNENDLRSLLDYRMEMQSIRRYLAGYKFPASTEFLRSTKFKEEYSQWPQYKKKTFLHTVAGVHWKQVQEIIEK